VRRWAIALLSGLLMTVGLPAGARAAAPAAAAANCVSVGDQGLFTDAPARFVQHAGRDALPEGDERAGRHDHRDPTGPGERCRPAVLDPDQRGRYGSLRDERLRPHRAGALPHPADGTPSGRRWLPAGRTADGSPRRLRDRAAQRVRRRGPGHRDLHRRPVRHLLRDPGRPACPHRGVECRPDRRRLLPNRCQRRRDERYGTVWHQLPRLVLCGILPPPGRPGVHLPG